MKVSVVTATYNSESSILRAQGSVHAQRHSAVEHVVIDGASADRTVDVVTQRMRPHDILVSEPDSGIYEALNKGIVASSGDVIGFLHSDDIFENDSTLDAVCELFRGPSEPDLVYGGLKYIRPQSGKTLRTWPAKSPRKFDLQLGWMPPHPTVFAKREVYEELGLFDTSFRISGDYDWLLRAFSAGIRAECVGNIVTLMATGGASNKSLNAIVQKMREDVRAIRSNNVGFWPIMLAAKNLRKVGQLLP